jgi:hypothetical protein
MDPNDPYTIYAGYEDVYQSTDGGFYWFPISFNLINGATLDEIGISAADPNTIYAGTVLELKRTNDAGNTWTNVTGNLPVGNQYITSITVSNTDANKLWVTMSGYSAGQKVYMSTTGGGTWTNISGSLPNVPADAITRVNNSNDDIYVGTDFGVYYKNASMNDWVPFDNNMPHVIVDELEVNYVSNTIRAATYGRGLWESPLQNFVGVPEHEQPKMYFSVYPNPSKGMLNVSGALADLKKISVKNILGEEVFSKVENNFSAIGNIYLLDLTSLKAGIYFVELESAGGQQVSKIVLEK